MIDFDKIIKENRRRNKELDAPYDPYLGIGSPIERFAFVITPDITVNLPLAMKEEPLIKDAIKAGSLISLYNSVVKNKNFQRTRKLPPTMVAAFARLRIKYDFEYWAAITIKIKHKETAQNVWFVLNRGQRRLLKSFEKQRQKGVPIRTFLVKARQWGGSTLTEFYATWLQVVLKTNWNSCIIGDIERQALTIRGMYSNAALNYPKQIGSLTLKPFEGSKDKQIVESGSIISVGSMQKPEALRSQDLKIAHFSEVASFKKTEGKSPKDLIQSIKTSIPYIPDTMIVEESTAKGVGNYFHNSYKRARDKENNYDLVFVSWFDIERNRIKIVHQTREKTAFIKSMSKYEWWLWELGATLEGIKWYRTILKTELMGDEWAMKSENPSTAEEAFQSTGHRVFAPSTVLNARKNNIPFIAEGVLYADAEKGEDCLKNITFEESKNGHLRIWALPDKSINVSNRYVVSVDIGGVSKGADWSILRVIDKYWMIDSGVPETVATIKIHIDNDLLAWMAVQLAEFYNHALVVVENNSLKKHQNTEGNGFYTILNEVAEVYDNLYLSSKQDTTKPGVPIKYGFHTNSYTKPLIINTINAAMRDDGYIERDSRLCDEADQFEHKPDGTLGAVDGAHDDFVMSTAIGLWVALHDSDPPVVIEPRVRIKKKTGGMANF